MSAQTTLAFSRAKINAVARPIPLASAGDDDGFSGEIVRCFRHEYSPGRATYLASCPDLTRTFMIRFDLRPYERLPMVHFIMDCRVKRGNNNIEQ